MDQQQWRIRAIDIEEVVGVSNKKIVAHVCVSTHQGIIVLNKYIRPTEPVIDYCTIKCLENRKRMFKSRNTLLSVRKDLKKLLKHCILVGNDVRYILSVLKIQHPKATIIEVSLLESYLRNRYQNPLLREASMIQYQPYEGIEDNCISNVRQVLDIYDAAIAEREARQTRKEILEMVNFI